MSTNKFGTPWTSRRGTFKSKDFEAMQEELAELQEEVGSLAEQFAEHKSGLIVDGATKFGKGISEIKLFVAKAKLALGQHAAKR